MKVFLRCAGGIGNVRLEGQVETSDLAQDLARKIEMVLAPEKLEGIAASPPDTHSMPPGPFMTDAQEVEIAVQTATNEPRSYRLNEAELPDQLLEVIDELRYEITRQKAAGLGRKIP